MTRLQSVTERSEWNFDDSNQLILARLYLVPNLESESEFFKNFDVASRHHYWELGPMAEIRRVFVHLDGGFKPFTVRVIWWERFVPHEKAALRFFYIVLFWYILGYLRYFVSISINRKAALTNLANVEVQLSKNRVFFHLVHCLLPPLKRGYFLFMFVKLSLLLKFYVVVSACLLL